MKNNRSAEGAAPDARGIAGVVRGILKSFARAGRAVAQIWSTGTIGVKILLATIPVVLILFVLVTSSLLFSVSGKTTKLGLKNIGELATQVGYYTNVEVIEGSKELWGWKLPLTHSKYIFSYDGIIKAGIDFADVDVQVNEITKTIYVTLPEIKVLSNEIGEDSLRVYDESMSIFTPLTLEAVNTAQDDLKKEAETTAIENGLFDNARMNAETLVRGFLAGVYDLTSYTMKFE